MSALKNKTLLVASLLVPTPVLAHNPRAGESSLAWFALTKQGGELISLDRCECQLRVISNQATIAQPPLKAIKAEQYQGIPGAEVVFPKAGVYQLEISGKPKAGEEFSEFKLAYDVTVQAGQTAASPAIQEPSSNQNFAIPSYMIPGIIMSALTLAGLTWVVKRSLKK